MKKDELFLVGKIVGVTGLKGEAVVRFSAAATTDSAKMESVFIEINENLVPFFIEKIQYKPKNQAIANFLDLEGFDELTKLVGCGIYILSDRLPPTNRKNSDFDQLVGYAVVDASKGRIGRIVDIIELPYQSIIKIGFEGKEILVPIVPEIVKKVDRKKKTVFIEAPEGLIGIYL